MSVASAAEGPVVLDRRRIELVAGATPKQPYHAVEHLPIPRAAAKLEAWTAEARRLAEAELCESRTALERLGYEVAGCALLLASGAPLPPLPDILASHARIHAAEGEHFRDAIRSAAARLEMPLTAAREKTVWKEASERLRTPTKELEDRIQAIGKDLGPPWTEDQKLAAVAAWMALAPRRRA